MSLAMHTSQAQAPPKTELGTLVTDQPFVLMSLPNDAETINSEIVRGWGLFEVGFFWWYWGLNLGCHNG
jgi:hypothetical protein